MDLAAATTSGIAAPTSTYKVYNEAMSRITHVAVHHAGGLGDDNFASTRHLTVRHIDRAHKQRWNFAAKYIPNSYSGYTFIYDPKDRSVTQTRAIGEETAAVRGYNFSTISIAIIGNYNKRPVGSPGGPVDPMTPEIVDDIAKLIHELLRLESNFSDQPHPRGAMGYIVAPGTQLDLSTSRIHPHRFFSSTHCYGTALDDNIIRDRVLETKPNAITPTTEITEIQERIRILSALVQLYARLVDLMTKKGIQTRHGLGHSSFDVREHPENMPEEVERLLD